MKNFIAFQAGQNSGICSHQKAIEWSENLMTKQTGVVKTFICEIIETVEKETPPFVVKRYEAPETLVPEIVEAKTGHFDQLRKLA
jgi:hypothetical protein